MKHVRKFDNASSPDELHTFLDDLLVEKKFGPVGVPSIEASGMGDIIGAVYDDDMETVTLVVEGDDSLFDDDEDE